MKLISIGSNPQTGTEVSIGIVAGVPEVYVVQGHDRRNSIRKDFKTLDYKIARLISEKWMNNGLIESNTQKED